MPAKPSCQELENRVHHLERALEKAELLVQEGRSLFDSLGDAVFVHPARSSGSQPEKFVRFNESAVSLFGYSPEELSRMTPGDLDDAKAALHYMPREVPGFQEGRHALYETTLTAKDGRKIPVEVSARLCEIENQPCIVSSVRKTAGRGAAGAALYESEERFRALVESSPMSVLLLQNGRYIYGNPASARFLGYGSPDELRGRDAMETLDPAFHEEVRMRMGRVQEGEGGNPPLELRIVRPDGEPRWCISTSVGVRLHGEPAVIIVGQDITDRKLAEKMSEQSEKLFRALFEQAAAGISIVDKKGKIIASNRKLCDILGYTKEEFDTLSTHDITFSEDVEKETALIHAIIEGSTDSCDIEKRYIRKDGEVIWGHLFLNSIRDANGSVQFIVGIVIDITERKASERALFESERQKNLILTTTSEKVFYFDPDLRIIWANHPSATAPGGGPSDIIGKHCYRVWGQQEKPCPDCTVQKAIAEGVPQTDERQTSGRIWSVRAYPVFDSAGNVEAAVSFGQDITEQRHLKEQFYQSQKMESIGRLAGGVAHDLNNLLSPILGYGEMLLEDAVPGDPRQESIKQIVDAGKRAQTLVRQLLAFSRKQPLQFQAVDLNKLLRDFKRLLRRTLREDIEIQAHLDKAIPRIQGDVGKLEQVVMNLAVNAQDAMPQGGTLTMETARAELDEEQVKGERDLAPGSYVMLAISDTGSGMDAHTLAHMFEPFFSTKEKGKGTGLGMSTAYGIIKQHGGDIWAFSKPGTGSTIRVYLPAADEIPAEPAHPPQKGADPTGTESVLLVEDDQQVRSLAAGLLERYGYRVLAAESGHAALSLLEGHTGPLDLLLTDVVMPGMNGRQLYEAVSGIYPQVRVIYMSGYTDDVIADHGILDTGVHFIEKPFSVKTLAAKIREVLDNPDRPDSPESPDKPDSPGREDG